MIETLIISRLGQRGDGIADTPDGPVFIAGALPDETVAVMRHASRKDADRAELVEVLTSSAQRATPFCPLVGRCGGCATQHMGAALYATWKRGLVVDALARTGLTPIIHPMIDGHGAGRRRVTFHARREQSGWILGFMAARSHDIIEVETCPVLESALSSAPQVARKLAERLGGSKPLDIQVTTSQNGLDVDMRGHGPLNDKGRQQGMILIANELDLARLSLHGETLVERHPPLIAMGRANVAPPPGGFLQATQSGEGQLAARLVALVPKKAKRIADLFSGCGPFAIRLAELATVHAVDSEKPAMFSLTRAVNFAQGLKGISTEARDLFRRPLLESELNGFDMVVLDPPRAGAEAQVMRIAASHVPLVAYVSCNAASFARDAAILVAGGYVLDDVTPVDQFRYSAHVELVGVFRKLAKKR